MTDLATQQGLDLPPSSRQDIVSALLNDYGSSFGHGDTSPYNYSPVPALKELPQPPPPEKEWNYSNEKPLPSAGYMNMSMRFQLRVDEPAYPDSPDGSRSSTESQPRRIVSRSLSRSSKPPSLKLLASNGSTAALPPTPGGPSQTPTPMLLSKQPKEEKSLPPPPPEKSELRQQRRRSTESQSSTERPRKDSLQSQEEKRNGVEAAGPVKRKPVPKFTSLADLGNGPRGGKGGPLPVPRTRKQSVEQEQDDRPIPAAEARRVDVNPASSEPFDNARPEKDAAPRDVLPVVNQLPPTPDENPAVAPPPPRKPFAGMGLPSNPRSKGQETPKHIRGKSSTGFNLMTKGQKSAPPLAPAPNTITPGPTPSPRQTEQVQQTRELSPVSPIKEAEQRRPFSFESVPPPSPPRKQEQTAPGPASARPASPVSPIDPPANPQFPPRSTSRAPPPAFASLPSQQRTPSPENVTLPALSKPPSQQRPPTSEELAPPTPTTPPFTPLTIKPAPTVAPAITLKHLNCYSHHSTYVWSKNDFQPMPCMICKTNDRERKWACVWCYLRICVGCSQELMKAPGRDLGTLLEKRSVDVVVDGGLGRRNDNEAKRHDSGNPTVVVWKADEEEDFS